ncbi:hypothetical protein FOA52_012983 [Chlamydomonas sp. UWO 241]|nr:hypothetical protein FOA52_012983 [Chlamydomonas sp. UWO 241]
MDSYESYEPYGGCGDPYGGWDEPYEPYDPDRELGPFHELFDLDEEPIDFDSEDWVDPEDWLEEDGINHRLSSALLWLLLATLVASFVWLVWWCLQRPRHINEEALRCAAGIGDESRVHELLDLKAHTPRPDPTALRMARANGHQRIVRLLRERKAANDAARAATLGMPLQWSLQAAAAVAHASRSPLQWSLQAATAVARGTERVLEIPLRAAAAIVSIVGMLTVSLCLALVGALHGAVDIARGTLRLAQQSTLQALVAVVYALQLVLKTVLRAAAGVAQGTLLVAQEGAIQAAAGIAHVLHPAQGRRGRHNTQAAAQTHAAAGGALAAGGAVAGASHGTITSSAANTVDAVASEIVAEEAATQKQKKSRKKKAAQRQAQAEEPASAAGATGAVAGSGAPGREAGKQRSAEAAASRSAEADEAPPERSAQPAEAQPAADAAASAAHGASTSGAAVLPIRAPAPLVPPQGVQAGVAVRAPSAAPQAVPSVSRTLLNHPVLGAVLRSMGVRSGAAGSCPADAAPGAASSSLLVHGIHQEQQQQTQGGPSATTVEAAATAAAAAVVTSAGGRVLHDDDDSLCVVCMDAARSVTLLPCKHRVLCAGCCPSVRKTCNECPMCRTPVQGAYMEWGGVE